MQEDAGHFERMKGSFAQNSKYIEKEGLWGGCDQ